jgi:hypothetical protein
MGPRGLRPGVEFGIDAGLVSPGQADARIEEPPGSCSGLRSLVRARLLDAVVACCQGADYARVTAAMAVFVRGRPVYRGLGERPTARPGNGGFRDSHHEDTKTRRNPKEELLSFPRLLVSLSPCLLVSLSPCLLFRSDSRRDTCTTKNRDTCTTKEQYLCTTQGEGPRCDWQTGCRGV